VKKTGIFHTFLLTLTRRKGKRKKWKKTIFVALLTPNV